MNAILNDMLCHGEVTVGSTKKDGSERVMRCTLSSNLLPLVESEKTSKKPKVENSDVRTVYDLDAGAWRSFRWDSVKYYWGAK